MKTAPLTRLTKWLEPKILGFFGRHGLALGLALGTMVSVADRSNGPWNIAIFAGLFAAWKAALDPRVQERVGALIDLAWTRMAQHRQKRLIQKGPAAWIARFPHVSEGSKTRMLGHATLKGADGKPTYQIRITAEPGQFDFEDGIYLIRAYVGINNLADPDKSRVERMQFSVGDGRIGAQIRELDPGAPRIGERWLVINLLEGQTVADVYEPVAKNAGKPPALAHDSVAEMVEKISDRTLRREASVIALEIESAPAGSLPTLRRRAARLLHPDTTSEPGAGPALSAINARIDKIQEDRAA